MVRGCATNQMVLAKQMIGGSGTKNNPVTIDQVSNDDVVCNDINQCDVDLSEEYDGPDEFLPIIGAVQGSWVCFYCNKRVHLMRGCFDICDKKPPNPKGKKLVGEIEEDIKDVSYLDGKDDLIDEIDMWNKAIIDDILW
jgi:uncharacterized Zn-finger protein